MKNGSNVIMQKPDFVFAPKNITKRSLRIHVPLETLVVILPTIIAPNETLRMSVKAGLNTKMERH
jgi:hypothetical protein